MFMHVQPEFTVVFTALVFCLQAKALPAKPCQLARQLAGMAFAGQAACAAMCHNYFQLRLILPPSPPPTNIINTTMMTAAARIAYRRCCA